MQEWQKNLRKWLFRWLCIICITTLLHFPFKLLKITVSLHSFYFYCYCIQCWKLLELYCVWHNRGWKKKKILFLKDLRGFSRDYDNYSNRKRMILRVLFHSDRGKTIYWNVMEISDSFALRRKKVLCVKHYHCQLLKRQIYGVKREMVYAWVYWEEMFQEEVFEDDEKIMDAFLSQKIYKQVQ